MSNFNIGQFMAEFQNGFQKPSQYRCKLPINTVAGGVLVRRFPKAAEYLATGLVCQSTRTPSRQFETTPLTIYGYEEKYPTFTTYTDLECTFHAPLIGSDPKTAKNDILQLFHAWQELIHPRSTPSGVSVSDMMLRFPDEYRLQNMELELLNPYNSKQGEKGLDVKVNVRVPIVGNIGGALSIRDPKTQDESQYASEPTIVYQFQNVYPITVESTQVSWASTDELQTITVTFAFSYWALYNKPVVTSVPTTSSNA
jgi:hypothetical protein